MSWRVIAKKEFDDARRSMTLQALAALFVLIAVVVTLVYARTDLFTPGEVSIEGLIGLLSGVGFLLPIIAILLGYRAIAGQRSGGQLHLTLSLPHTRGDVLVGTFVGRAAVLLAPVVLAFGVGLLVALATFDAVSLATYVGFLLLISLLSLSYLALSVGVSASTGSTKLAATILLGIFFVTQFVWGPLFLLGGWLFFQYLDLAGGDGVPIWMQYLYVLSPDTAYSYVLNAGLLDLPEFGGLVPLDDVALSFAVVVLVAWVVLPLAIGYALLERADL